MVREYADRGYATVLLARRLDRLENLAEELKFQRRPNLAIACDVTREGDLEAAVKKVIEQFGRIDVVIANAGFAVVGTLERLTLADYDRQYDTNVRGVLRTIYATLSELKKTQGRLALIGSVNGFVALPTTSAYVMSKFAIRGLAECLQYELKPYGVSVTHICPGFITTEIRKVGNSGVLKVDANDGIPSWIQMPAAKAARQIFQAIDRRKKEKAITFHGWLAIFIGKYLGNVLRFVVGVFSQQIETRGHK